MPADVLELDLGFNIMEMSALVNRKDLLLELADGNPDYLNGNEGLLELGLEEDFLTDVSPYILVLMRKAVSEVESYVDSVDEFEEDKLLLFYQRLSFEVEHLLFKDREDVSSLYSTVGSMIFREYMNFDLLQETAKVLDDPSKSSFINTSESLFLASWRKIKYFSDRLELSSEQSLSFGDDLYFQAKAELDSYSGRSGDEIDVSTLLDEELLQSEDEELVSNLSVLFRGVLKNSLSDFESTDHELSVDIFMMRFSIEIRNLLETGNLTSIAALEIIREFKSLKVVRDSFNRISELSADEAKDSLTGTQQNIQRNISAICNLEFKYKSRLEGLYISLRYLTSGSGEAA